MCGIIGLAHVPDAHSRMEQALRAIEYRGKDSQKIFSVVKSDLLFGHNLHSIIDFVEQPLVGKKGVLVVNCEIYNWKELATKYALLDAHNDAELLLLLLDKFTKVLTTKKGLLSLLDELDGDYAFAYYSKVTKKIYCARDTCGIKPLVYFVDQKAGSFGFASEKKALEEAGIAQSVHLNPRQVLIYDPHKKKIQFLKRELKKEKCLSPFTDIKSALMLAVAKRTPEKEFALLLSGGLDSTLIGKILQLSGKRFSCYFAAVEGFAEAADLAFAEKAAALLGAPLHKNIISVPTLEAELPKIMALIESTDPIRVAVASTLYFATQKMQQEKIVFSGLGADELFAGYGRFARSNDINKDCFSYLIKLYENDLYYQDIVCMKHGLELRVPFLDTTLVNKALALSAKEKIADVEGYGKVNKKVLREIALSLGIPAELSYRPKKAAQYGSNIDKAIEFLAKKKGYASKAEYLMSVFEKEVRGFDASSSKAKKKVKNIPIGALLSTGKDSVYALHLLAKQGYVIKCLITLDSHNPDSYMFHTPTIALAKLQAKALGIPLITVKTKGVKEEELLDLEKAIRTAKEKYGIEGVCSGALYSNYQRERIETICEKVGIRAFAPLWHMDQITYLKHLVKEGYEIIITKIACFGLSEKWLGRKIDSAAIGELARLAAKNGMNPAGEGGEYESLVLYAPLFSKMISVAFTKKMSNEFTGEIVITESKLVEKK